MRWALAIALIGVMLLTGCGTESTTTTAAEVAPTTTTANATTTTTTALTTTTTTLGSLSWGESDVYADDGVPELEISVEAPEVDATAATKYIDPGRQVCVVLVTIRNLSVAPHDYNKFDFTAYDGRDFEAPHPSWYRTQLPELEQGTLPPGGTVKGYVPFDLPDDQRIVRVQYDRVSDGRLLWWHTTGGTS
ncbi:MAG: DUF4352 domain-containing protein [Actinobacteria bacterium]|nr:DUF4352 domain-containing protein [Actinomycetota bacterium]